MSIGELIPEHAREGLADAAAQLPWDIHAESGNVYLAVLLRGANWAGPSSLAASHELAEQQVRADAEAPEPPPEPTLKINYA